MGFPFHFTTCKFFCAWLKNLHERLTITIVLAGALCTVSDAVAQTTGMADSVAVTYLMPESSERSKKLRQTRFQIHHDTAGISFKAANLSSLPRKIRSIRFVHLGDRGKLVRSKKNRKAIVKDVRSQLLSQKDPLGVPLKSAVVNRFLSGRFAGKNPFPGWIALAHGPSAENTLLRVEMRTGLFRKLAFSRVNIPVTEPVGFPAIDLNPCMPFDRFFERKKLLGYGLDKFRYKPFRISTRKITRKNFTVYFPKNSIDADARSFDEIVQYIKENDLSIIAVRAEGSASVEGDSLKNHLLQRRRAERLISVLERYNNEPINLDTVITVEGWSTFREAIRQTEFNHLDTLTNAELREFLNSTPAMTEKLESILSRDRKALMQIVTARKLTREELIEGIQRRLDELGEKLLPQLNPRTIDFRQAEAEVLGIFRYFDKLIEDGNATFSELANLVDTNPASSQLKVLLFYHFMISFEAAKDKMQQPLDSVFAKRKWNNLFLIANSSIISLIATDPPSLQKIRLSQAVDIQYYTNKFIEEGILGADVLCSFSYPMDRRFYGLKLQHYALLENLSRATDIQCFQKGDTQRTALTQARFDEMKLADFFQKQQTGPSPAYQGEQHSYDMSQKGDYYFFIRTLFVNQDKAIQSFVRTSDNMIEFDLLHLLERNVSTWNPVTNFFYDSLITFSVMNKLIDRLRSTDDRICDNIVNQLYLDFYHKTLVYAQVGLENGAPRDMAAAEKALKFISAYYGDGKASLFPALRTYVIDALASYYWLPTRKAAPAYSYPLFPQSRFPSDGEQPDLRKRRYDELYGKGR